MKPTTLIAALASLMLTAVATPANANDYRKQVRAFFDCAFTPAVEFDGTIVEAAVATPDLSELVNAVVAADLVDVLSSEGPFTVFAPINAAFENIPESVLNGVLGVTDEDGNLVGLQAVLGYHVIAGTSFRNDPRRVFNRIAKVETSIGQSLFFSRDREGTEINQSNLVSCRPVKTSNGIVYLIDSVFLPQF